MHIYALSIKNYPPNQRNSKISSTIVAQWPVSAVTAKCKELRCEFCREELSSNISILVSCPFLRNDREKKRDLRSQPSMQPRQQVNSSSFHVFSAKSKSVWRARGQQTVDYAMAIGEANARVDVELFVDLQDDGDFRVRSPQNEAKTCIAVSNRHALQATNPMSAALGRVEPQTFRLIGNSDWPPTILAVSVGT